MARSPSNVNVQATTGALTINGTQAIFGTTLNTGNGVDVVKVQANANPLTVNGGGFAPDVAVFGFVGSLAGITAPVTLNNLPTYFSVTVNDWNDSSSHPNVTLSASGLVGLAPAITFGPASLAR